MSINNFFWKNYYMNTNKNVEEKLFIEQNLRWIGVKTKIINRHQKEGGSQFDKFVFNRKITFPRWYHVNFIQIQ